MRPVQKNLALALGFARVSCTEKEEGSRTLLYFRSEPVLNIPPEGAGSVPCLQLLSDVNVNCWLVVEVALRRSRELGTRASGEHFIEHLSVKTHLGETLSAAKLMFRAEWDARESEANHAQPHWNIHEEAWRRTEQGSETLVERLEREGRTFADWDTQEPDARNLPSPTIALRPEARMHFALSATWQDVDPRHKLSLQTPEHAVRWVSACCAYIKDQLVHINRKLS